MSKCKLFIIAVILILIIIACGPIKGNDDITTFIQISAGAENISNEGSYSMGYTNIDETLSQYLTINNISENPITIEEINLSNNPEGYFELNTSNTDDIVQAGSSTVFKVSFTPTIDVEKTVDFSIVIDMTKDEYTFSVTGSTPRNIWLEMIQNQPSGYDQSTCPTWRHSMPMVSAGDDRIILFGGSEGAFYNNDVWEYTISTNEWNRLMENDDPSASAQPDGRYGHNMVHIGFDRIIIFGGVAGITDFNDTWEYDIASNQWTNLNPSSGPSGRKSHSMAYNPDNDKVYLFGGYDSVKFDDLWEYDVTANQWTEITTTPKPPARMSGDMVYTGDNKLYLFGGKGQDLGVYYNDLWEYDITADVWTEISIPGLKPSVRWGHQMDYISGENAIFLFGGHDADLYFNDSWKLTLDDNNWIKLDPQSDLPPVRWNHATAYDESLDKIILFGGNNTSGKFNDTWKYFNYSDE